jgi:hypothetical protein
MKSRLQWFLEKSVSKEITRTIYNKENQTEALNPLKEHCSLHYLLFSPRINQKELISYIENIILNFTERITNQAALVLVVDRNPAIWNPTTDHTIFQFTAGHFFFMERSSGLLYFRNVWGNHNEWETSSDHLALIEGKLNRKWQKQTSSLQIRVASRDMDSISMGIKTRSECADLQLATKRTFICAPLTVAAEVTASAFNFTTHYYIQ